VCWWNNGEEEFPANGQEVEDSVQSLNFLNFTIVTFSWVEHASSDKLRTPGLLFLLIKLGNQLSVCI